MNAALVLKFGPLVVIALLFGALGVQSMRLTHAEQEFMQYKLDQQLLAQQQIDAAAKQRKDAENDFIQTKKTLEKTIAAGDAYRRCVAAGRCGVVRTAPSCANASLPATEELNAAGPDAVPAADGDAAIGDCAITTLMLNKLQNDIEKQGGY